LGIIEEGRF